MTIPSDSEPGRLRRSTSVIETALPDELILLDPMSGEMFSLNSTGRFIWERLGEHSSGGIAQQLAEAFAVSPARAEADVRATVMGLWQAGLVEAVCQAGD